MSGCLYCVDGCALCRPNTTPPAWFKGRSAKGAAGVKLRRVLAGRHPFGFQLGPADKTCCDCKHYATVQHGGSRFAKCAIVGQSRSAASDGAGGWRACERFVGRAA